MIFRKWLQRYLFVCVCVYVKEKYAIYMKHPVYSRIQLVSKDCL